MLYIVRYIHISTSLYCSLVLTIVHEPFGDFNDFCLDQKEMSEMNIRRLHPEHEPPLDLLLTADPSEKLVNDYLKRGQCYTAEIDRRIAGVYVLLPTRPETAELVNIAVKEDLQGKGIGRQLVMHAIETAKAQGFKTIEIGTGNSSIGQLALYQKCGFRITGIDRNFFLRHCEKPIYENGMRCIDMIRLSLDL